MLDVGHVDPTLEAKQGTKYAVWTVSNEDSPCNLQVEVRFISIRTGTDVKAPITYSDIQVAANATTEISADTVPPPSLDSLLEGDNDWIDWDKYDPFVIHVTARRDGERISTDTAWPQPFKYLDFSDRRLSFGTSAESPNRISISAGKPVKGLVFEEMRGVKFSENNFDLVPGQVVVMDFSGLSRHELRYTYVGAPSASMEI